MGYIKDEEIRGYRFENEIVCPECATEKDLEDLKQDDILTEDEIEKAQGEGRYFCDRCKGEIG